MMFGDTETGVVIADGRCGVRLTRLGDADAMGYPTRIEVSAASLSGVMRDDAVGFWRFVEDLETLHSDLSGEVQIYGDSRFRLKLTGDGRGHIGVQVVVGDHLNDVELKFRVEIDQTYLPSVIQAMRREFPAPAARLASAT